MLAACRCLGNAFASRLTRHPGPSLAALGTEGITQLSRCWISSTITTATSPQEIAATASFSGRGSEQSMGRQDLVDRYLSIDMLSRKDRLRHQRHDYIAEFQRHRGDVGSPEVMVATWTNKIRERAWQFARSRKDRPNLRKLEMLVHQRRRYLTWMRRAQFGAYCYVLHKLGLRDIYTETPRDARYNFGSRHGDPVDERVRSLRFNRSKRRKVKKAPLWVKLGPRLAQEDPQLSVDPSGPDPGTRAPGAPLTVDAAATGKWLTARPKAKGKKKDRKRW